MLQGLPRGGGGIDTNTSDLKAPNKSYKEEKPISEMRNAGCTPHPTHPHKKERRKKKKEPSRGEAWFQKKPKAKVTQTDFRLICKLLSSHSGS